MASALDVSVVLPVHNEKGHSRQGITGVPQSLDSSPCRGSGSAWKAARREARGDVAAVGTDVDMTYLNDEIPHLAKEQDDHDQVVGARTTQEGYAKLLQVEAVPTVLSHAPLRVFFPIGFTLLFIGRGKLADDWTSRDFRLAASSLPILFAASRVIAIGLLADLVVHVTKPRGEVTPASHTSD